MKKDPDKNIDSANAIMPEQENHDASQSAEDLFDKASDLYNDGKEVEAYELFSKSAEMGYVEAMRIMGDIYMNPTLDHITPDYAIARDWYEKASKAGNRDAMCSLGRIYLEGLGAAKDYEKAYQHFEQSAKPDPKNRVYGRDGSSAEGCYWAGMMCYVGAGREKDLQLAHKYLLKSYKLRLGNAIPLLHRMYERGEGVKASKAKAAEFKSYMDRGETQIVMIEGYEFDLDA